MVVLSSKNRKVIPQSQPDHSESPTKRNQPEAPHDDINQIKEALAECPIWMDLTDTTAAIGTVIKVGLPTVRKHLSNGIGRNVPRRKLGRKIFYQRDGLPVFIMALLQQSSPIFTGPDHSDLNAHRGAT